MLIRKHTSNYNFVGDTKTGATYRWGTSINSDPISAPWPELADISISNHCSKQCSFCYRNSKPDGSFMSVADYEFILSQLTDPKLGGVFQVAIGGGEPTEHPDFIKILKTTKAHKIIPNYTTNGLKINKDIIEATQKFCGAIAISLEPKSILSRVKIAEQFLQNGIKTNYHYILSNDSISEAIEFLEGKYDKKIKGINAIIFLTYKPFGRADKSGLLKWDTRLNKFLKLIDNPKTEIAFGFDACFVPILMKYTSVDSKFIDSCECGFFSVYIDERLNVKPCSFTNSDKFTFNLRDYNFKEIWQNKYQQYRKINNKIKGCVQCKATNICRGGCPYFSAINLCQNKPS